MKQKNKPTGFLAVCYLEEKGKDLRWAEELFSETASLAFTAGMDVLNKAGEKGSISRLRSIDPRYYMTSGVAAAIGDHAKALDADSIIVNLELSPSQQSNLSELCGMRILSRTELIYEIFLERSNSSVSKIQIELANLRYMKSRLTGSYKGMDRIRGGIGIKGPGETKLEIDRRTIGRRISRLKQELQKVDKHFRLVYESRKDMDSVSIVGYTNAGKTSLLNALTGADEKAENLLFSTVEVRSRKMSISSIVSGPGIVLSDTIGFIRDLPHHLVESFQTTLMDIKFAGLVLIVVDISSPFVEEHLRTVRKTLEELGCLEIPSIIVCNKIDKLETEPPRIIIDDCLKISTKTGQGIQELRKRIIAFFEKQSDAPSQDRKGK